MRPDYLLVVVLNDVTVPGFFTSLTGDIEERDSKKSGRTKKNAKTKILGGGGHWS